MYVPSSKDEPLQPFHAFNHEQGKEIAKGLQPGNRLAYDQKAQKFVALSKKTSDERYIQDLEILSDKVNDFIESARGKGMTDQDIWNIEQAALTRSFGLKQRVSGLRGLFVSKKSGQKINQKAQALARMAMMVESWATGYLDDYRLVAGKRSDPLIESRHREWYLNQGIYLENMQHADEVTQRQLGLAILHGYSKAATIREEDSRRLEIQTTPVLPQDYRYHRGNSNQLLTAVNSAYAKDMSLYEGDVHLVASPLVREVFAREMGLGGVNFDIGNTQEFELALERLFEILSQGWQPETMLMFDITRFLENNRYGPQDMGSATHILRNVAERKMKEFMAAHPWYPKKEMKIICALLQPYTFSQHAGQHVLLTPHLMDGPFEVGPLIDNILHSSGYSVSPDQAKTAWLNVESPEAIFEKLKLPMTTLATRGTHVPEVCSTFNAFLAQPILGKFEALSSATDAPSYLKILPQATVALLKGLGEHKIDQVFQDKGIRDVLQISYFRMINAMNEAILRKDDLTAFNNQIELLHQEIQTILTIVEPYQPDEFTKSVRANLTSGTDPLIASDFPQPQVHLKHAAMHSVSSTLAGIEAEKGTQQLNVAVLKDSYYESDRMIGASQAYEVSVFDGDVNAFQSPPSTPLDVFLCEFHHNISLNRQEYRPEGILDQVKGMVTQKMVAEKFTVIIDTTINLEQSDDIRSFLNDPMIKKWIQEGKLNVVLIRSAQKFDMMGIDNYYGGISIAINDPTSFAKFNERMDHPDDQLEGLSYQGLTHLEKYGSESIERYRQALMESTLAFYDLLPPGAIYEPGTTNPMQISKIDDERLVFIDIKFPGYPETSEAFLVALKALVRKKRLPFSERPSFGFATTNFVRIQKGVGEACLRITPGLESEATMRIYAELFTSIQDIIDAVVQKNPKASQRQLDALIADRMAKLEF